MGGREYRVGCQSWGAKGVANLFYFKTDFYCMCMGALLE